MSNHIVVLSGGLDSTNALAGACQQAGRPNVRTVSFDYGQRHRARELAAAVDVAAFFGVPHRTIDLSGLLSGSALLDPDVEVPEGHYAEDTMSATVVNGRNLLFASAAVGQCQPGDHLWFGVHAGDHPIYPDCRPEFWDDLTALVDAAYRVTIHTPFLFMSKAEALTEGNVAGAPYWLTFSCYNGGDTHCGRCGTCVERAEAFDLAGIADPTEYADPTYWRRVTA